ncbi:MAG TPA: thioredoxin family protein, partial [Edaphobacter sp.]|nr:thioredoxin family protein [Edaphobacter sp.]
MLTRTPPNRRTPLLSAITLLALAASATILGCKSNQPASPAAARQPVTPVPAVKKHLYSAEADPKAEIAAALKQAGAEHKRVILDFGGDWCGDCQVLDIYFH